MQSAVITRSSSTQSLYNYCSIGRYALLLLSLISRFDATSPLLSFAMTPEEISGVAHAAPLHIFYGEKFGFMYPFKLRTLLKNIIIASASVGSAFDPTSSFKTMMMAAIKAPLLLVSSTHRAEGAAASFGAHCITIHLSFCYPKPVFFCYPCSSPPLFNFFPSF